MKDRTSPCLQKWFAESIERLIIDGVLKVGQPLFPRNVDCVKSLSGFAARTA